MGSNQVTLTYRNGAFTFDQLTRGPASGYFYIVQDRSLPAQAASVGIAMAGSPIYVVQAAPNINLTFTPHPTYWVTFGSYQPGQVLDLTQLVNVAAPVPFSANNRNMTAILNPDNTWTVKPG